MSKQQFEPQPGFNCLQPTALLACCIETVVFQQLVREWENWLCSWDSPCAPFPAPDIGSNPPVVILLVLFLSVPFTLVDAIEILLSGQ
jgi:hypothetical protein